MTAWSLGAGLTCPVGRYHTCWRSFEGLEQGSCLHGTKGMTRSSWKLTPKGLSYWSLILPCKLIIYRHLEDIKALQNRDRHCVFQHVIREGNSPTHVQISWQNLGSSQADKFNSLTGCIPLQAWIISLQEILWALPISASCLLVLSCSTKKKNILPFSKRVKIGGFILL